MTLTASRGLQHGNAFDVTFSWDNANITFASLLEAIGEIPIPPYLNRSSQSSDKTDYQTVYSHIDGSVAAPTAGLHFTDNVLAECDKLGIIRRELTLHVGAGTFQPVKSETIGGHDMHTEFISVPRSLLVDLINFNNPVIAVGTTSVRTLESLYYIGLVLLNNPDADEKELCIGQWMPYETSSENISTREALQAILDYLETLKKRYRILILSNTNHYVMSWAFSADFSPSGKALTDYADRLYLSYQIGYTKPAPEIFKHLITAEGLRPEEALFVDDGASNIARGEELGFQTFCPANGSDWRADLATRLDADRAKTSE